MADIDKVKELVGWVAEILRKNIKASSFDSRDTHIYGIDESAKQILSHPDLALIDGEKGRNTPQRGTHVCANCWISTQNDMLIAGFEKVIPLASTIKEKLE